MAPATHVVKAKPDPRPMRLALGAGGLLTARDSESGAASANAAKSVAAPSRFSSASAAGPCS